MKGLVLSLAVAGASLLSAPCLAQNGEATGPSAYVLDRSEVRDVTAANGRRYRIFAAWPEGEPPPEGYPVIYTLDANIMFATMVETVRALDRRPDASGALVVGIGYPPDLEARDERAIDLTAALGSEHPEGTGGAEAFLRFVAEELKPGIAGRFAIDESKETIFGHSYAGHFVLYALVNRPGLFDNFVAASPSIWFEDRLLARENLRKRIGPKLTEGALSVRALVTVGENEQAHDPDFPPGERLARLLGLKQIDNAREYAAFLDGQPGLDARFEILPGEDHGTVIPAAISRAVRFALAPGIERPDPAPPPQPMANPSGIAVPDAAAYLSMTADERYDLRLRVRALPEPHRRAWVKAFDHNLSAGLTYGEHRRLHEERVEMDRLHGTAPVGE